MLLDEFNELYRTEFDRLMRELKRTLRDEARREEAIADAFVELYRKLERGEEVEEPRDLLFTIARRRAIDATRTLVARQQTEIPAGALVSLAALSDRIQDEEWASGRYPTEEENRFGDDFDDAVRLLGDDFDPYVLTELRGLSTHEAAGLLGIHQTTVLRRADRARVAIREEIT